MVQDKANIFKLSKEEQKEYRKDPFFDCMPGAKDFAKALEQDVLTKETPYVLLLEKNYGMGKTFFSTRFAQYLRNNKLEAIYFSAWENDYLPDPFLSFSKELQKYFHNINLKTRASNAFDKFTTSTKKLTKNIFKATQISAGINAGAQASVTIDNEKIVNAVEELFNDFKEEKDSVQEFKEKLSNFINKLPKKKLVLIVDELDRCRPDYAMKVLEIIKHFFDIEGLFVIVPTNQDALESSLEALYGIKSKEQKTNCENYFKKFFNKPQKIPEPDYLKLVKDCIKPEYLSNAIDKGHITLTQDKFNSFNVLVNNLSNYGKSAQLSLREMTQSCKDVIHFCNHFYEEIRLEYLTYLICNKEKERKGLKDGYDQPLGISLGSNHPYFEPSGYGQHIGSKEKLFNFSNYKAELQKSNLTIFNGYYYPNINITQEDREKMRTFSYNIDTLTVNFNSFAEIQQFINEQSTLLKGFQTVLKSANLPYNIQILPVTLSGFIEILKSKKLEVIDFQEKYGSDDTDKERQARYKEIIEKPETIYSL